MSDPTHDPAELGRKLENLLADFFRENEGALLKTFLIISEVIDPDGKESLWLLGTPGLPPWTTLGYLEYMKAREMLDD
ncbi:MAG: hypothetical protein AB7L09_22155 [Nitrospira sp.]